MNPGGGKGPSKEELEEKRIRKIAPSFMRIQKQMWDHSPAVRAGVSE